MESSRIRFSRDADRAKAVLELAKRARATGLPGHVYEVSARGLKVLDDLGLAYEKEALRFHSR